MRESKGSRKEKGAKRIVRIQAKKQEKRRMEI